MLTEVKKQSGKGSVKADRSFEVKNSRSKSKEEGTPRKERSRSGSKGKWKSIPNDPYLTKQPKIKEVVKKKVTKKAAKQPPPAKTSSPAAPATSYPIPEKSRWRSVSSEKASPSIKDKEKEKSPSISREEVIYRMRAIKAKMAREEGASYEPSRSRSNSTERVPLVKKGKEPEPLTKKKKGVLSALILKNLKK